ncbi:MAG: hypothetical protein J6D27_02690 [Ruminiclostridium sp.]|nr:hypothetical protein [Ruminiclostridium sp.]
MAIECVVITLILLAIIFSFAHVNRIRWVIATVPIAILPCANSLASVIYTQFLGIEMPKSVAVAVILIAAMVSCIWIGIASTMLHTKRMKIPYLVVGFLFNIVLGFILVNHYLQFAV